MVDAAMVAGALTTGVVDGAIQSVYVSNPEKWTNKFPFVGTVRPLPPVDDWIVLAVPAVAYAAGYFAKSAAAKSFGLGGLLYAGAMFVHHIIVDSVRLSGVKLSAGTSAPAPQSFRTRRMKLEQAVR